MHTPTARTLLIALHAVAALAPAPARAQGTEAKRDPPPVRVEWRDGKTRISAEQAYIEISNRVQVRYTHEFPDEATLLPVAAEPGESRGSFRIRRAKFKIEGWIWRENLTYELQLNWPGASSSNPAAVLEDAYIGWDPAGARRFRIVLGQFKVPLGRQELTSSGSQQLVDRAIVSNEYARGRDTGVAVQGVLLGNRVEYRAGVFNGGGPSRSINDNTALQYNARVMWQPNGAVPLFQRGWSSGPLYSEGDFESKDAPLYAVGASVERNDFHGTTTNNDLRSVVFGVDGVYKYRGFFGTGEYFWRRRTPETGGDFGSNGWYAQAGQMLNQARTVEAAFRYGTREVNDDLDNDDSSEVRGGLNYYYRRHSLKVQGDFGRVETRLGPGAGTRIDYEVRVQTQFVF